MPTDCPALLVFLGFFCLLAVTQQDVDKRCTKGVLWQVEALQRKADTQISCRLYTPTSRDFEICPGAALRCFAEELQVLAEEWELNPNLNRNRKARSKFNLRIQKLASYFDQTEPGCRQCELLKEEDAKTFLQSLNDTLQIMRSQFCP
ncbi:interleukin 15, like isoform X2 [Amphiprion ocellaris]|uniref:interleukin 15, like isoform X2 n=1 Tax=Amphiprion ocellaris TaxID=80972 RepID=UPI00164A09D2|nr:interleukin 15, like isoform X2 [Amphiprion ocellaris]